MGTIPDGWYKLTADVKNPTPDGRKKDIASQKLWHIGTVVYVDNGKPGIYRGHVEFSDKSRADFGPESPDKAWNRDFCQANVMFPHLEPVPVTVGRFCRKAWADPNQLLAALVEFDGITLERLKALDDQLESLSEEDFDDFTKKHGVSF